MEKEELLKFLKWLTEENIARWYKIEEEAGGIGYQGVVDEYIEQENL